MQISSLSQQKLCFKSEISFALNFIWQATRGICQASESLPTLAALKLHKWLEIAARGGEKGVGMGKGAKSLNCLRPTDRTRIEQTTRAELTNDNTTREIQNLKYSHTHRHRWCTCIQIDAGRTNWPNYKTRRTILLNNFTHCSSMTDCVFPSERIRSIDRQIPAACSSAYRVYTHKIWDCRLLAGVKTAR